MVKEALRMPQQMTHAHMGYIRAITSLIRNIAHAPSKFTIMTPLWFQLYTRARSPWIFRPWDRVWRSLVAVRILIIFILGAQKLIAKEQIVEQICILLQDVDRHNDQANHTIKEYDLDGVIEGCIGALHACRNVSLLVRRALTDADIRLE